MVGTGFMGMKWDGGDVAFRPEVWIECLRVLKPGGYLLAFGGTRTYHRLVCAVEDAGFEIRDMIAWLYGSGFPKGTDKAKIPAEFAGFNTALKPAIEPIVVARKPMIGALAENLQAHSTGAMNIAGCRIDSAKSWPASRRYAPGQLAGGEGALGGDTQDTEHDGLGRWPANVVHDGSEEVVERFPQSAGQQGDVRGTEASRTGGWGTNCYGEFDRVPFGARNDSGSAARFFKEAQLSDEDWLWQTLSLAPTAGRSLSLQNAAVASALNDAATWALPEGMRCAVSSAPSMSVTPTELRKISESLIGTIHSFGRECWLASPPARHIPNANPVSVAVTREPTGTTTITLRRWSSDGSAEPVTFSITATSAEVGEKGSARFSYCAKASRDDRNDGLHHLGANHHPTVKPTELMTWLVKLVTPPGGTVLDPFMGSGSTGRGAVLGGVDFIGIEMDAEYAAIAAERIRAISPLFAEVA